MCNTLQFVLSAIILILGFVFVSLTIRPHIYDILPEKDYYLVMIPTILNGICPPIGLGIYLQATHYEYKNQNYLLTYKSAIPMPRIICSLLLLIIIITTGILWASAFLLAEKIIDPYTWMVEHSVLSILVILPYVVCPLILLQMLRKQERFLLNIPPFSPPTTTLI